MTTLPGSAFNCAYVYPQWGGLQRCVAGKFDERQDNDMLPMQFLTDILAASHVNQA